MAVIVFDVAAFRSAFPVFSDATAFPPALLQGYWNDATCIISANTNCGILLKGACRERSLYLLTAHLAALGVVIASGQTTGVMTQATIDKVSITMQAPPTKTAFQWWLTQTPYGQQLLALLQAKSAGGFVIGGLPERYGFRKVGGTFGT
jgi:hypothetical protein